MSVFRVGSNKSSVNNFPSVRPTLDLDFANSKTLDPRITFTRASGGSYVGADGLIKLAGVNEARFDHDPVTGESLGLLIEESRTNLVYPSQFTSFEASVKNNLWYEAFAELDTTPNAGIAPDGTTTAALISCNTTTSFKYVTYRTLQSTAGTYSYSVFCKASSTDVNVRLFISGESTLTNNTVRADFTLTGNGTVASAVVSGTGVSAATPSIQPMGNGWYRCVIVSTFIAPTNITCLIYPGSGSAQTTASQTLIWGAQLEVGSFPTSYIPTIGSTRTRAADNASITGKNFSDFYNQDEGTLFCSGIVTVPEKNIAIIKIRDSSLVGTTGIGFQMDTRTGNKYNSFRTRNRIFGNALILGINTADSFKKFKGAGSFNLLNNVTLASFDGLNSPPNFTYIENTENILEIGPPSIIAGLSSNPFNGTISKFTYYTRALSQSQLQALTR